MYKAPEVGGQVSISGPFSFHADWLLTLDSRFGMGHCLRILLLLDFIFLGPQIIKAGKTDQP